MAQLAIKGHATRGKEVIKILEMFGGRNSRNYIGELSNYIYTINEHGIIDWYSHYVSFQFAIFTLEEFLKKFPYKVGDKVQHKGATSCGSVFEVEEMCWEGDTVMYTLCLFGCNYKRSTLPAEYLQPYKEETVKKTMEEIDEEKAVNHVFSTGVISFDIAQRDKYELDLQGKFHVVLREGKYYVERIKPQYPNTYEECCGVLSLPLYYNLRYHTYEYGYGEFTTINELCSLQDKLNILGKLLICRDAYWKIAGEQMGLGKPWEFKLGSDSKEVVYAISVFGTGIMLNFYYALNCNKILVFPTEEMRDVFYKNFKGLIEQCKELL